MNPNSTEEQQLRVGKEGARGRKRFCLIQCRDFHIPSVCICKLPYPSPTAVVAAVIKIWYLNSTVPSQQDILICSLQRRNGSKDSLLEEKSQLSTNVDIKTTTKMIKTVPVSRFKVET